jgi:phosphoribosylglycinamide formyltransferase-1
LANVAVDAPAVSRPRTVPARVVVLLSGTGTLCAALLAAAAGPEHPYDVVAVGADRPATGLAHARERGVETFVTALGDHADRAEWDRALAAQLTARRPDWVVCAGFMKLLGPAVLDAFPGRVVNTHPALLPAFPGAHAVRDALAAGVEVTGATVHLVDAGLDTGPVLTQRSVPVLPDDDEDRLHERIKTVERELLVQTLDDLVVAGLPPVQPAPTRPARTEESTR